MKISEKLFVVTGAGNGLGRELTLALLAGGARVAAVDIDQSGLKTTAELAGQSGQQLTTYQVDITDKSAVQALPVQVIAEQGAIDGLINNAGVIQPFVRIKDLDYEAINRVMNINFYGSLYMTKEFLPHLLDRPEAHIVNVSSMGGFLPVPGQSIYGASKAAVKLFTEALHSELADTNVGVTVAFPGALNTEIAQNSGVSDTLQHQTESERSSFNPMDPSQAAQILIGAIEGNKYRVLIGSDSKFMDFIYRVSPRRAANYIKNQMKSLLSGRNSNHRVARMRRGGQAPST